MAWYVIGAAVIAVLFVLNAVVYVVRGGKRPPAVRRAASMNGPIPRVQAVIILAAMGLWAVCFGAMQVAPGTALGHAMAAPWALASLAMWLMAGAVLLATVVEVRRRRRERKGA